jgi:TolB-like protein/tetratricopeptide (TPR) repeat protein
MTFVHELRRRKVMRVAAVYAATAFVLLQAADLILPALALPEWTYRLLVLLALFGLPIALVLGWAFELTPDGVRATTRSPTAGEPPPSLLGRRTIIATAFLLALGVGLGAGLFVAPTAKGTSAGGEAGGVVAEKSVAVLPFADFSPGADQEWFSDGLTEEILSALARLPDLHVASRTGSFRFKGSDLPVRDIAAQLGVGHILEGSVRRTGERVRITAQLIRASDDAHVWSQNFDRGAGDVIRIQEEIAFEIARTLQTALEPEAMRRMVAAGTNSVAAYEAYLRGRHFWRMQSRDTLHNDPALEALAAFDEARTLDPQFSDAHRLAADLWLEQLMPTLLNYRAGLSYRERERRVRERAQAAAATAPDELRRLRAESVLAQLEIRLRDALELMRRAAELQPSDWEAWWYAGTLAVMVGEYDTSRTQFRRAVELAGDDADALFLIANWSVDLDTATVLVERALALDPLNPNIVFDAHKLFVGQGRLAEAADMAERFHALAERGGRRVMIDIRQACAEGREQDAAVIYDSAANTLREASRWQSLMLLGRHAEATELLRSHDDAGEFFALAAFLHEPHFDPRPYPNLSAALRRQGVTREPVEIRFACGRRTTETRP